MVESSLLRMRKPCFFVSSSEVGSGFSFPSFSVSSGSFFPGSPSSSLSVSATSSESLQLFAACEKKSENCKMTKKILTQRIMSDCEVIAVLFCRP